MCKSHIGFSLAIWLSTIFFAHALQSARAENGMKPYEETGFYVGMTWDRAELSNESSDVDADTDGTAIGWSVGYRLNENWRLEYHSTSVEFDDTRAGIPSVSVTDIEGDYQDLMVLYTEKHGDWLPYFGISYSELDFTETHAPLDGPIFRRAGGTIETKEDGFALMFGTDYPLTDRFHLRADWIIYNADYLENHDLIRLGSVFHF